MSELKFFNLQDGQSADVRLLHSSVNTIEQCRVHYMQIDGKRKAIRCCDTGCPICSRGNQYNNRAYIRLWDYTDNTEKVWVRTNQILAQFDDVAKTWGTLSNVVMRITRVGKDYPTYNVVVCPPNTYPITNAELDIKIAYRFSYRRSIEEINEFYRTGVLPERKKQQQQYVSKEAYAQQKANNQQNANIQQPNYMPNVQQQPTVQQVPQPTFNFAYVPQQSYASQPQYVAQQTPQPQHAHQGGYNQTYVPQQQPQQAPQQAPQFAPMQNTQQSFVNTSTGNPVTDDTFAEDSPFSDVIMDMPRRV